MYKRQINHENPDNKRPSLGESSRHFNENLGLKLYEYSIAIRKLAEEMRHGPNQSGSFKRVDTLFEDLNNCLAKVNLEALGAWERHAKDAINWLVARLLDDCASLAHCTKVQFTSESIEYLLQQVLKNKSVIKPAYRSFYAIGLLVKSHRIVAKDGLFRASIISPYLNNLALVPQIEAQAVSQSLYCVALLAKANLLDGLISLGSVKSLLKKLPTSSDLLSKNLTLSLYSLGLLAQVNKLAGTIEAQELSLLLNKISTFKGCDEFERNVSNAVYGIGLLQKANCIKNPAVLGPEIDLLLNDTMQTGLSEHNATQLLFAVEALWPHHQCSINWVIKLLKTLIDRNVMDAEHVANLINNYLVRFKSYHQQLDPIFNTVLQFLPASIDSYSKTYRERLMQTIHDMEGCGNWSLVLKTKLGLVQLQPTHEVNLEEDSAPAVAPLPPAVANPMVLESNKPTLNAAATIKSNSPIYQAIAGHNLADLQRILGITVKSMDVSPKLPPINANNKSKANFFRPTNLLPYTDATQNNRDRLIQDFFTKTETNALQQLIVTSTFEYFDVLLRALSHHVRYQLAIDNALDPIILYLSPMQLKSMNRVFIDRGLYRDHDAVLTINAAMERRKQQHPKQAVFIRQLQLDFLEFAAVFHKKSKHIHVYPIIQNIKKQLLASGVSKAGMFVLQTQSALKINGSYQYETEDINALLRVRIRGVPNCHILAAITLMDSGAANGNNTTNILNGFFTNNESPFVLNDREHTIIIPIQVNNNHWVGIRISMQLGSRPTIYYYNSLSNVESDTQWTDQLFNDIGAVFVANNYLQPNLKVCQKSMQQDDGTSCGAFMIENIACDLEDDWWDSSSLNVAEDIRLLHANLLKDHRPDFFTVFNQKQFSDPVPFLTGFNS